MEKSQTKIYDYFEREGQNGGEIIEKENIMSQKS